MHRLLIGNLCAIALLIAAVVAAVPGKPSDEIRVTQGPGDIIFTRPV